jgi:hypothetical protein
MTGLVPVISIHVQQCHGIEIAGTSPAMTLITDD